MERILVVEDDADLLDLTCSLVGEKAKATGTRRTADALRLMGQHDFDMLVTDLNVQQRGDGLILAGAMRSLHPHARNVMITGYPDFAGALAAIQATLDQILIKPVEAATLRRLALDSAGAQPMAKGKFSLHDLLRRHHQPILNAWLTLVEADALLGKIPMSPTDRLDHMQALLLGLVDRRIPHEKERLAAQEHGRERRRLAYRPEWISLEIGYLRRVIFDTVLRELLEIELSTFPAELFEMDLRLDADLLESLRAFGLRED